MEKLFKVNHNHLVVHHVQEDHDQDQDQDQEVLQNLEKVSI